MFHQEAPAADPAVPVHVAYTPVPVPVPDPEPVPVPVPVPVPNRVSPDPAPYPRSRARYLPGAIPRTRLNAFPSAASLS